MRIIGVTGGIGSGKSTVSRQLSKLGAKIVDADIIAREVTATGGKALKELAEHFGPAVLNRDGSLNRKALGDIVFGNDDELRVLDSITHKYIAEKIRESVERLAAEGMAEIIVVDAAIPIQHGFLDMVDEVWVVTADREVRKKRIIERNGISEEEAIARIDSQKKDEDYFKVADHIIYNNGEMPELCQNIERLLIQGDFVAQKKNK